MMNVLFVCTGDEDTVMSAFRTVRDDVEQRVQALLQQIEGGEV